MLLVAYVLSAVPVIAVSYLYQMCLYSNLAVLSKCQLAECLAVLACVFGTVVLVYSYNYLVLSKQSHNKCDCLLGDIGKIDRTCD